MRRIKKQIKSIACCILALNMLLGLVGCSSVEDDYVTDAYESKTLDNRFRPNESEVDTDTIVVDKEIINTEINSEVASIVVETEDFRIQVPKSSLECEGLNYQKVVNLFKDAGFVSVKVNPKELENIKKELDGSVILVSIDGDSSFESTAKFDKEASVVINYRVLKTVVEEIEKNNVSKESTVMVWIPKTGTKYHSRSGCSNMKNPSQVTKEEAVRMGYEPCKKCY